MIQRLRSNELVGLAPWVRTLRLAVLAIVQTVPIAIGGWIVGAALGWGSAGMKPSVGHVLAGFTLMVSGVLILSATYRDWRYGAPFNRRRTLLAGLALLVMAPVVLVVVRR
jgi:heme A synthase